MKTFKKLFLITSILLLTFSLNGSVFATNNCNNYNFDKDKYLTRLNNVLNKVKSGNKSAAKMQTLLSRLKTKYSNYPSIKGMIGYLNYNIDNSFVCITGNTTTDAIENGNNDVVNNDSSTDEACKANKKYDCHSDNQGDAFTTINGSWCLNGKALKSVEEANELGVYCGDKNLKGLCTIGKENEEWTCSGSGYVSNAISGQNAICKGTKYYSTLEKAKSDGITCERKTTNKCSDPNKVDQSKYESIFDNKGRSHQIGGVEGVTFRKRFKDTFNPTKMTNNDGKINIDSTQLDKVYVQYYSNDKNMKTIKFKIFVPPGVEKIRFADFIGADATFRCDNMKFKYWVGPVESLEKGVSNDDLWNGGKYIEETGRVGNSQIYDFIPPPKDYKGNRWIYARYEIYDNGCSNSCTNPMTLGNSYVSSNYYTFDEKGIKEFKKWYDNMEESDKWEENGDPEYDCTNY